MKHKIRVNSEDKMVEIAEDEDLLTALTKAGHYVKSSCGGVATCSDCIVKISFGEDHLNGASFEELKLLGNVFHITKERLACQTYVKGDISVEIDKHNKELDEKQRENKSKKRHKTVLKRKSQVEEEKQKRQEEFEARPPRQGGFRRPKRQKK